MKDGSSEKITPSSGDANFRLTKLWQVLFSPEPTFGRVLTHVDMFWIFFFFRGFVFMNFPYSFLYFMFHFCVPMCNLDLYSLICDGFSFLNGVRLYGNATRSIEILLLTICILIAHLFIHVMLYIIHHYTLNHRL